MRSSCVSCKRMTRCFCDFVGTNFCDFLNELHNCYLTNVILPKKKRFFNQKSIRGVFLTRSNAFSNKESRYAMVNAILKDSLITLRKTKNAPVRFGSVPNRCKI